MSDAATPLEKREAGDTPRALTSSEITALSHLYRGEVHRAALWRTRLDTTTNWAVVTTGIALSIAFSSSGATSLPIVLVSFLLLIFLFFETRRYRYFDLSFLRVRVLEVYFFSPMLKDGDVKFDERWNASLSEEYFEPHFHLSFLEAFRSRLRRNYIWIFIIQIVSYWSKIIVHPEPLTSTSELFQRSAIGPMSGAIVFGFGMIFYGSLCALAFAPRAWINRIDDKRHRSRRTDPIRNLVRIEPV